MKVLRIGRPPYRPSLLAELSGLDLVFHPDPNSEGFLWLNANGVAVVPLGDDLPAEGTLLLPDSTGPLEHLVQVVDRLLGPGGCPWDQEQTHASLKGYLLEECYELFDAIDSNNAANMQEELGDVLLQPMMHAAMQRRDGGTNIDRVATEICRKLVRRHPHVFGHINVDDSEAVLRNWDAIKKSEKGSSVSSVLAGIPRAMPALAQANEVSKRAARSGFEWPNLDGVWFKMEEEVAELREAVALGNKEATEGELGDLLFTIVNLARWLDVEPEHALNRMLVRFRHRFSWMEAHADQPLSELTAVQFEELWNQAKADTEPG